MGWGSWVRSAERGLLSGGLLNLMRARTAEFDDQRVRVRR